MVDRSMVGRWAIDSSMCFHSLSSLLDQLTVCDSFVCVVGMVYRFKAGRCTVDRPICYHFLVIVDPNLPQILSTI